MGGKRVFELILEIGHKSSPLNKRTNQGYTHKWTAFVRGVNNSKIEHCIQRVVFQLHESFDDPFRSISEPPFQVKETGYAGFEIPIQIFFKNREKPNHLTFVHDLCLLTGKPNDSLTTEKLKFINPNKEFEKCLIKSGAQLLTLAVKKERSDSPPAKKQKSSSLIPSKDMSKQSQLQPTIQPQVPLPQHQTQQQSVQKPKSSRDFIDVFGAPLVFNSQPNNKDQSQSHHPEHQHQHQSQLQQNHQSQQHQQNHHHHKHSHQKDHHQKEHHHKEHHHKEHHHKEHHHKEHHLKEHHHKEHHHKEHHHKEHHPKEQHHKEHQPHHIQSNSQQNLQSQHSKHSSNKEEQFANDLRTIQTKISCLSDGDRLQRIVDIVEEAGEWFNLTPKKFEFDLKRLDKKTLSRIEKCLQ